MDGKLFGQIYDREAATEMKAWVISQTTCTLMEFLQLERKTLQTVPERTWLHQNLRLHFQNQHFKTCQWERAFGSVLTRLLTLISRGTGSFICLIPRFQVQTGHVLCNCGTIPLSAGSLLCKRNPLAYGVDILLSVSLRDLTVIFETGVFLSQSTKSNPKVQQNACAELGATSWASLEWIKPQRREKKVFTQSISWCWAPFGVRRRQYLLARDFHTIFITKSHRRGKKSLTKLSMHLGP